MVEKEPTQKEIDLINNFLEDNLNSNYVEGIKLFYDIVLNNNSRIIDLSKLFNEKKGHFYVDSVHYNDSGNLLIANRICQSINLK